MSIIEDVKAYLQSGEKNSQDIGLEIEHFVVDENGDQIGFDLVTRLIEERIAENHAKPYITDGHIVGYDTGEYTVTLEPACQFEVSVYPRKDLGEILSIYNAFYKEWEAIFAEYGYRILTRGNLPKVELGEITPREIPLSPKLRYKYMNRYFRTSGQYGRYMMRASGSTQVSIDYRSEEDMVRKLRILEIISPFLMILMENKSKEDSCLPGVNDKPHLLRIQEWEDLDPARTGYFPKSFDSDFGYASIADTIVNTPLILLNDKGETTYVAEKTALDLINDGTIDYDRRDAADRKQLIEHFISMGFFHYRVKKYIEIRIADAVPIEKSVAFAALIKGLLYSEEGLTALEKLFRNVAGIEEIQQATEAVERDGVDASVYEGRRAQEWIDAILDIAEKAADEDDKKYLEKIG
ncbi:MAG: glutamate-cysteine ligase family protein [Eubacteriales bacterium]|nr:glutamate-cysteine ligase family protein [Eubacteriales bacterium]